MAGAKRIGRGGCRRPAGRALRRSPGRLRPRVDPPATSPHHGAAGRPGARGRCLALPLLLVARQLPLRRFRGRPGGRGLGGVQPGHLSLERLGGAEPGRPRQAPFRGIVGALRRRKLRKRVHPAGSGRANPATRTFRDIDLRLLRSGRYRAAARDPFGSHGKRAQSPHRSPSRTRSGPASSDAPSRRGARRFLGSTFGHLWRTDLLVMTGTGMLTDGGKDRSAYPSPC